MIITQEFVNRLASKAELLPAFRSMQPQVVKEIVSNALCYLTVNTSSSYRSRKVTHLTNSMFFDFDKKIAVIILKGEKDKGLQRKQCKVVEVSPHGGITEALCIISKNKDAEDELLYMKRYAHVRATSHYTTRKGASRIAYTFLDVGFPLSFHRIAFSSVAYKVGMILKRFHDDGLAFGHLSMDNIYVHKDHLQLKVDKAETQYMVPESKALSKKVQARASDMYKLGCVLYQYAFDEKLPWADVTDEKTVLKVQKQLYSQLGSAIKHTKDPKAISFFSLLKGLFEVNPMRRMRIDAFLEQSKELLDSAPFLRVEMNKTMKVVYMNEQALDEVHLPKSDSFCELFGFESDCTVCTTPIEEVLVY